MSIQKTAIAVKIGYIFAWAFIASYYFLWGTSEVTEAISYADESGWVPYGAFAHSMAGEVIYGDTIAEE
ncbi:hypothetical protein M0802_010616 [Mischocyttarus mexicanus]|nr:hypothetical protein M0802_010616 [Mischocyttarus mexicanus]